uniref:HTH psq-type domain-containing protein n=1 Tax=Heterorhabditis bacteriophora TaxID=37862 RepID=A0A1I7WW89_HETBA
MSKLLRTTIVHCHEQGEKNATITKKLYVTKMAVQRTVSIAELHKLKEVSKEVRGMIARNWRHNFYHLPLKTQIRSLNETPSGDYKIDWVGMPTQLAISIDDFSRIFTYCSFDMMFIDRLNITSLFCDQLQNLRRKKISTVTLFFLAMKVHRERNVRVNGVSNFIDHDLSAASNVVLVVAECCLSEHALRTLLEVTVITIWSSLCLSQLTESKRNIESFESHLRNEIDVDSLFRDVPNPEKTEETNWLLTDVNGKVFVLTIARE